MTRSVLVRYFAAAAEAADAEEETLALPEDATVGWLHEQLVDRYGPQMALAMRDGSFLVDGVAATDTNSPLGGTVDVLPPFAGG
jgi:molybdopterin converting factor small subunit